MCIIHCGLDWIAIKNEEGENGENGATPINIRNKGWKLYNAKEDKEGKKEKMKDEKWEMIIDDVVWELQITKGVHVRQVISLNFEWIRWFY